MNLDQIRECMYEMANYEEASKCMYEILQNEGFLPETLDEGDSYENHMSAMLEDDDVCNEMFECWSKSTNECGSYLNEWMQENYSPFLEDMNDGVPDASHFLHNENDDLEETWEGSPMLTQQIDEEPEGNMYIARLEKMKEFVENILNKMTPDQDVDAWVQDKITLSYDYLRSVSLFLDGEDHSGTNTPETNDIEVEMPHTTLVGALAENELPKFEPKKGKGVDKENKTNSSKEDKDGMKNAEKSQKTVNQKVEDKVDVKFSPDMESKDQKEVNKTYLGAWNMLNLDFQNGVPDSYKKRVELEVTTGHSRPRDEAKFGKEANVDHESTERIGKAMLAASRANQEARDDMYNPNPIVTKPYQKTSITGGDKKSTKINEQLDRIKSIMNK